MGCLGGVHSWTLAGLAAAFVDLAITYSLLCVSAFAFLPSKFLSFLGIGFPCLWCGSFWYRNDSSSSNLCLYRLLINWPIRKIVSVQELVKSRFPFDLACCDDYGCCNSSAEGEGKTVVNNESGFDDVKERKISSQKQKYLERRRRRAAGIVYRKHSSALVSDFVTRAAKIGDGGQIGERSSLDLASGTEDGHPLGLDYAPDATLNPIESRGNGKRIIGKASSSSIEKSECTVDDESLDSIAKFTNTIQDLERELEEERAARAALYQELEKERAASASAADEAMAMILRLQEEKASIKMELRQSQRMVEEKFAYDEEELNMLQEILIRREREIHFLEKEVEGFQQMSPLSPVPWNGGDDFKSAYEEEVEIRSQLSSICEGTERSSTDNKDSRFDLPPIPEELTGKNGNQVDSDTFSSVDETESRVYDVHVVDDEAMHSNGRREMRLSGSCVEDSGSWSGKGIDLQTVDDGERSTSDHEVGWLQERLRVVQQERETLTSSAEKRDKFSIQLKVMEEIVNQLREIQRNREPVREA